MFMQVNTIGKNEQSFNGYLTKGFYRMVERTVKGAVSDIIEGAYINNEQVSTAALQEIQNYKTKILKDFSEYAGKLHKDIYINKNLVVRNLKIGEKFNIIDVYSGRTAIDDNNIITSHMFSRSSSINYKNAIENEDYRDALVMLQNIGEELNLKIYPDLLNKRFLVSARQHLQVMAALTSGNLFGRFKAKLMARAIDKYAQDIGVPCDSRTEVKNLIESTKEMNIGLKKGVKAVKKERRALNRQNKKTAASILK